MTWLITLKGLPGSGKTTLARALSRELGWPLIDKDDIKDVLPDGLDAPDALSYDVMVNVVRRQLLQGLNVICDSPLHEWTYQKFRRITAEIGVGLVVIECRCSDEGLWRDRIEARQDMQMHAHRMANWQTLQAYRKRHADLIYPIHDAHLIVDTALPLPDLTGRTLDWLTHTGMRLPRE